MLFGLKAQDKHLHAITDYHPISCVHFLFLVISMSVGKILRMHSVTAHLPLEIQHPAQFRNKKKAYQLIAWGETIKKIMRIPLYWENAPLLRYGSWNLKYGQTRWDMIPTTLDLCLDTGHILLGSKNKKQAQERILNILQKKGKQIKHLHLHENDLLHDLHWKPNVIIDAKLKRRLTKDCTYIIET